MRDKVDLQKEKEVYQKERVIYFNNRLGQISESSIFLEQFQLH